jgi:integrin alpha FG-GAP repeat containing protein 1
MVFPVCDSVDANGVGHGCKIHIAYNKQIPFCSSSLSEEQRKNCRKPEALCRADPNFDFDLSEGSQVSPSISHNDMG